MEKHFVHARVGDQQSWLVDHMGWAYGKLLEEYGILFLDDLPFLPYPWGQNSLVKKKKKNSWHIKFIIGDGTWGLTYGVEILVSEIFSWVIHSGSG